MEPSKDCSFAYLMHTMQQDKALQAWWHLFLRTCMHNQEAAPHFVELMKVLQGTHKGMFRAPPSKAATQAQFHYIMDNFENTIFTGLGHV